MTLSRPDGSQYNSKKTLTLTEKVVQRICPKPSNLYFCTSNNFSKSQYLTLSFVILLDPVDGSWGGWVDWSQCSKSCGVGTETRLRNCDSPAPANGGEKCQGKPFESRICNIKQCKSIECLANPFNKALKIQILHK